MYSRTVNFLLACVNSLYWRLYIREEVLLPKSRQKRDKHASTYKYPILGASDLEGSIKYKVGFVFVDVAA